MKMTWKNQSKNKNRQRPLSQFPNLPFEKPESSDVLQDKDYYSDQLLKETIGEQGSIKQKIVDSADENKKLAEVHEEQGNKLAEEGKYHEALGKWETALTLIPERAVLYEQKAQVLLELGEAWNALKAATKATELEPAWAEAWITLGRAQLNFGEPDNATESFDRALAIKPESVEASNDRRSALHLIKRRKQLHSTGLSANENRFVVADKDDHP